MELLRFRVTGFRSVTDSGWIDTEKITALIGTNESGKTNLLLALWKLHPAKEGVIDPIADFPRKRYNEIRNLKNKPVFISADFKLNGNLVSKLTSLTGAAADEVTVARVSRKFDGGYTVAFPDQKGAPTVAQPELSSLITAALADITSLAATKAEEPLKQRILEVLSGAGTTLAEEFDSDAELDVDDIEAVQDPLAKLDLTAGAKRSTIVPRFQQVLDAFDEYIAQARKPTPDGVAEARQLVVNNLVSFVYYSNYGNLDSEIYLPHVIENLKRDDLGSKEAAKTRTLRVLFDFVQLSPQEILELGRDVHPPNRAPTAEEIETSAAKRKEREILLQSASSMLTLRFREWWRQGEYRIRFQADGNHFRIWVADDKRPEEIELEGRSAGLQWFLSFYLVFLVESLEGHKGAMLLLDEPGHSLHPLAQKDLSDFFESLAGTNQLIYTTHSPFLIDPDHLDRVKAVFVDDIGATLVSPNLRAGEAKAPQSRSIYPVHAALGLSVSETLLQGCQPVVVEGTSDQYYLSTIKNYLISRGLIAPRRELLFLPAGGVKGTSAIVPIIAGKDDALPYVILDGDEQGRNAQKKLSDGLYQGSKDRVIDIDDVSGVVGSEVEDIYPPELLATVAAKYLRADSDEELTDIVEAGKPILPQIEAFAASNNIDLQKGWKAELATLVKSRFQRTKDPMSKYTGYVEKWQALVERITK